MAHDDIIFFRRKLPHIQPKDSIFFVTFRLYGSLPSSTITALREEYESELRLAQTLKNNSVVKYDHEIFHRQYFERFDEFLERYSEGPTYLLNNDVAQIVADTIRFWNNRRYTLVCYCIMPNHVHLVIDVGGLTVEPYPQRPSYVLSRIMESLKRHNARRSNTVLHRTGHFWQKESYDHVIRDGDELNSIIRYIIDNPVTAGLVSSPTNGRGRISMKNIFFCRTPFQGVLAVIKYFVVIDTAE